MVTPTLLWFRRDLPGCRSTFAGRAGASRGSGPRLLCSGSAPSEGAGPGACSSWVPVCRAERQARRPTADHRSLPEQRIPEIGRAIGATSVHISADFQSISGPAEMTPSRPLSRRRRSRNRIALPGVARPASPRRRQSIPCVHPYFARWRGSAGDHPPTPDPRPRTGSIRRPRTRNSSGQSASFRCRTRHRTR